MGLFKRGIMGLMTVCLVCGGSGCPSCGGRGQVPLAEEPIPPTERLPVVPELAVTEPMAALAHQVVMRQCPPSLLVELAEQADASGELPEELLGEKIAKALARGRRFFSELATEARARCISPSQLLARMVLHGTLGPLVTPPGEGSEGSVSVFDDCPPRLKKVTRRPYYSATRWSCGEECPC